MAAPVAGFGSACVGLFVQILVLCTPLTILMSYAVITGGTQGIGKAIAERFLQEGFSIAICARTARDLESCLAEWTVAYPTATVLTFQGDLGVVADTKKFGAFVLKNFPQVDVLVNNAGTFFPGNLADEAEGHLEKLMEVNLYSAYHLTRTLLPAMKERRSGHIFNMCSIASLHAYKNGGAYSITKYALQGFSDNLRMELMEHNIKVTAFMPGATWTNSWSSSGLPESRFMSVNDISDMVWAAWSLSPSANVETVVMRPIKGDL